jgi:hypothetical protein
MHNFYTYYHKHHPQGKKPRIVHILAMFDHWWQQCLPHCPPLEALNERYVFLTIWGLTTRRCCSRRKIARARVFMVSRHWKFWPPRTYSVFPCGLYVSSLSVRPGTVLSRLWSHDRPRRTSTTGGPSQRVSLFVSMLSLLLRE